MSILRFFSIIILQRKLARFVLLYAFFSFLPQIKCQVLPYSVNRESSVAHRYYLFVFLINILKLTLFYLECPSP